MSLGGQFLLAGVLYALWTAWSVRRVGPDAQPQHLRFSLLFLIVSAFLALYTLQEQMSWDHLPFPFSLVVWAAGLAAALFAGGWQLARERGESAWPLLGLPAAVLGALLLLAPFRP